MERHRVPHVLRALLISFSVVLAVASCTAQSRQGSKEPAGPVSLPAVEVRQYQGANLSSVDDFRENSIKGVQRVDRASYRLAIGGLVRTPLELAYEQVLERDRYSKVVTLHCVEGWSATILWEGVKVKDLLAAAAYEPAATVVIFTAADGYTTSLPLEWLRERDILLASKMNGIEVPAERGFPFVLVAEDKWGYKWIKWVTKIEVSSDASYRGYWERRGYSQQGDFNGPMFDSE